MKWKFIISLLLLSCAAFSQFSKTHYLPPLSGSSVVSAVVEEQYLYISTPSTTPVNFKIIQLGSATISGTVSRDIPYTYFIGFGQNTQFHVDNGSVNTVLSNKGYIIEADDVVYVTARVIAGIGNQAGAVVSKGLAALGKEFRIGSLLNTESGSYSNNNYTFVSILATENNTIVSFNDIKTGAVLINNGVAGNTHADVILNSGQSYVIAAEGPTNANRDALIGSLVTSNKPIAINCGSFAGTNGVTNLDLGFDQIVSSERTGKEYIFIKSTGQNIVERVILVANKDNTEVFLNGNTSPDYVLNKSNYIAIDGSKYSANGNMYVRTTESVFAYQTVGDNSRTDLANQELFFVPPLNCETPKIVDNIPFIEQIGNRNFTGRVTILTKTGSPLLFIINGINYTLASLPLGIAVDGPKSVDGNTAYETYTIKGLTGNVSVLSTSELYVAAYGSDGAATFGGFYSGFTFKPEIIQEVNVVGQLNCLPNTKLKVSGSSSFDVFQWYFNNVAILGAVSNEYNPTLPGYYYVKATISACGTTLESDRIPVSICPTDTDMDLANDNIDSDYDNDGIVNCTESYGNLNINTSNPAAGTISYGAYSNSFTGIINKALPASPTPFVGNTDGSFVTEVLAGKGLYVEYNISFAKPLTVSLEYPTTANTSDLLNANAEYIVNSDIDKTVTVLNPTNQLLIDTNYDGIYENGVTEFSSFEIRFIINGNIPLTPGTGTFKLQSFQTNSIKITHKNLLNTATNKSTFKLITSCLPLDSDNDNIADQFDLDSDNDGILDTIEAQGNLPVIISNLDTNHNGLDNAFETGIIPIDTDNDGILDYLDLDSDNDGIYDLIESDSGAQDANFNGIIDGTQTSFGTNGLSNSIETTADSGILTYTVIDSDADSVKNYRELDSDNDSCNDVVEAGFLDPNADGLLGNNAPPIVNTLGIVTSGSGYLTPNNNYSIAAPIVITSQPKILPVCELQNVTITSLVDNGGNTYQWQLSTNGTLWNNIIDNSTYSGANTKNLTITNVTNAMNNYEYRIRLDKTGNSCGLISDKVVVTVYPLPVVNDITIIQCDDDLDAISTFNLTVKNNDISSNFLNETFTYYKTLVGANTEDVTELITTPLSFVNTIPSNMPVWARIANTNGCFRTVQINLQVLASNIPQTFNRTFEKCDDFISTSNDDRDGISEFDFSSVTPAIQALLPPGNYAISYYKNEADALSESDSAGNSLAIPSITNYRNIGYPNLQNIWVRVDNTVSNGCYGLGPFVTLKVNDLPDVKLSDEYIYCLNDTSPLTLDAGLQSGIVTNYKYNWSTGETTPTIQVEAGGTYTVEVKNSNLCTRNRTITVVESNVATITNIIIKDLSTNNSIIVYVTGPSSQYLYSLDSPLGPFQESNTFEEIASGVHIVYVKDFNGCGTIKKEINVLEAPTYFTPNGDGIHDFWNLKGINSNYNTQGSIYIFDRYGKLIKQISPQSTGWDGTFNGIQLPADDYWFEVKFEDGKNAKGHFSLKR